MSYDSYQSSRQKAKPIGLFLFVYGSTVGAYHAYTNAESDIVFNTPPHGDVTYKAVPIERSDINSSGTLDKSEVTVSLPKTSEISQLFTVYPPSSITLLTIREGHVNDLAMEFPVCWTGTVHAKSVDGNVASFKGQPITRAFLRSGLRRNYQLGCPHVLYGTHCKASKAAATIPVVVSAIGAAHVDLPSGWNGSVDLAKYTGGMVQWTTPDGTEYRTILSVQLGTRVQLAGPVRNLLPGDTGSLILGCNHQMSDCEFLHNNIQNYGGQPFIPTKNPFSFVSPFV